MLYKMQKFNFRAFRILLILIQKKLDLICNDTNLSLENEPKDLYSKIKFTAYDVITNILFEIKFITDDFQTEKFDYFSINSFNNCLISEINKTIENYTIKIKHSRKNQKQMFELQEEFNKLSKEYLNSSSKLR